MRPVSQSVIDSRLVTLTECDADQNMSGSEELLEPSIVRSVRMEEKNRIENRKKLWELVDRRNDALLYNKMGKSGFARYIWESFEHNFFYISLQDSQ